MNKESNFAPSLSISSQDKDKEFETQLKKVYDAFFTSAKTMKEVDLEIGVMRESICRHCRTLRLKGKLYLVTKRQCKVTRHSSVNAYTTNPEFKPFFNQLNLFPDEQL